MKNYKLKLNDKEYQVEVQDVDGNLASVKVNGTLYNVEIDREIKSTKTPKLTRSAAIPSTDVEASTSKTANPVSTAKSGVTIKSPLPGKILDIFVKVGDNVQLGQNVMCLEAMKMENNINADKAGVVKNITVNKGDSVLEGDVLIEF